jgi:hypothetical protein
MEVVAKKIEGEKKQNTLDYTKVLCGITAT